MDPEKRKLDQEVLPAPQGADTTIQRRRSAILPRRIIAAILGTFALWTLYNGVDTLHESWTQPASARPGHAGCHDAAHSYFDRLTGGGSSVYATAHHGSYEDKHHRGSDHHGKHGHRDKHDHHDKHRKHGDHGPPHPPHGPPRGPPHGPHGPGHDHGPPKWISPKEAEVIFLSVPNNDSIRA